MIAHRLVSLVFAGALALLALSVPQTADAHCDTLDGPVVQDARSALDKGDVTPVLQWVRESDEAEIRAAFDHALAVRKLGADARQLADTFFFETLVRVHRAGEGAPYSGLKPAGSELGEGVRAADAALDSGSVDPAIRLLTQEVEQGVRARFERVQKAKAHRNHNVEAGRAYVAAYVEYVHYVEGLFEKASRSAAHGEHGGHGEGESAEHGARHE
ncbi:MAG: hypothetical protein KJ042_03095 [Deltaproteobacteria bacterium]|nr:hypothetical protein [Deltaproteobacteria bacterium]